MALTSRKVNSSLYKFVQGIEVSNVCQRFIFAQQALQGSQFSEHDIPSIFKHVLFQR